MTYKEVAEILKIIDSSDCDEFVLELGDVKIAVRRHSAAGPSAPLVAPAASERGAQVPEPARGAPALPMEGPATTHADATAVESTSASAGGLIEVRSPMVGTFYRRPTPADKPFVEAGSMVKPGDPLCVVEVMKLFTTIHAEHGGRVKEICATDGALVEYRQILFLIEPA